MKLTITPDEIRHIVLDHLEDRGHKVDPDSLHEIITRDDYGCDYFDGFTVDMLP